LILINIYLKIINEKTSLIFVGFGIANIFINLVEISAKHIPANAYHKKNCNTIAHNRR
jgi:hypothetical protein